MRRFNTWVNSLLLVTTLTRTATAQDVKDIPSGDDKIVRLKEGDKAPFSGQLFDASTALRWSNWLLQYKLKLQVDVDYQKKLADIDRQFWERKLSIEQEKYSGVVAMYRTQVDSLTVKVTSLENELRDPPWYKSIWLGVAVGVVLTGTCVGLGVYASK